MLQKARNNDQIDGFEQRLENYVQRGRQCAPVVQQILDDTASIDDTLCPIDESELRVTHESGEGDKDPGHLTLTYVGSGKQRGFTADLTEHSLCQLASKVGSRRDTMFRDYAQGAEWERKQIAEFYNAHIEHNDSKNPILCRVVDGRVRGVLSNAYKRYNSSKLVAQFVKVAAGHGSVISRADLTDTRHYLEFVKPKVYKIETENNGIVPAIFGASFSNSDYGKGSVEIRLFAVNLLCSNGMVGQSLMRKIHMGSRLTEANLFSVETMNRETALLESMMQDIIGATFEENTIMLAIEKIKAASDKIVDPAARTGQLRRLSRITKEEQAAVMSILTGNKASDGIGGESTDWRIGNAITALARNGMNGERTEYIDNKQKMHSITPGVERSRHLEAVAGDLILGDLNKTLQTRIDQLVGVKS